MPDGKNTDETKATWPVLPDETSGVLSQSKRISAFYLNPITQGVPCPNFHET
jgi:hypothetical protein